MANEWYYLRGEQQVGPVSQEAIHQAAWRGELTAQTYVWSDGMAQWAPAGTIPGLLPDMAAPPMQAPPPMPSSAPYPVVQYAPPVMQTAPSAIAALVFGILGLFCLGPIFGIVAIVLGVVARNRIAREPGRYTGGGLATAGLVLGIVAFVLSGVGLAIWLRHGLP